MLLYALELNYANEPPIQEDMMTEENMTCYICKATIELREQFIGQPFEDKLRHMKCHEEKK
jgi:hypothetical protein